MDSDAYSVGDVLYILIPGQMSVLPVRVVESNLKTTIGGTVMSYMIQDPKGKLGTLKPEYRVYRNPDDVREALYKNAQKSIDEIVFAAVQLADSWERSKQVENVVIDVIEDDSILGTVELPDGSIAKLKKPTRSG